MKPQMFEIVVAKVRSSGLRPLLPFFEREKAHTCKLLQQPRFAEMSRKQRRRTHINRADGFVA
jgi:hypothetical protein